MQFTSLTKKLEWMYLPGSPLHVCLWSNLCTQELRLPSWVRWSQMQLMGARSSVWAVSKGSRPCCALLGHTLFPRQNWKIKCFIAEDPRELHDSCPGARSETPYLVEGMAAWFGGEGRRKRHGARWESRRCISSLLSSVHSVTSPWEPGMGHDGGIYSTEIAQMLQSGLSSPPS